MALKGTFTPITKNDEVTELNQVEVKRTIKNEVIEEEILSLPNIDQKIEKIQSRIDHLQSDIDELMVLRNRIENEAKKVKLRKDKTIEEPML